MTRLRKYLGEGHRLLVWTILLGAGGALVIVRFQTELAGYAGRPIQIGALVGTWLLGIVVIRRGERRSWRRLFTETPFERQNDERSRRPPLQRPLKRKTITVEPLDRGLLRQRGVRVRAFLDEVEAPLDVRLRSVGSGGADDGVRTGNDTLDDQFVLTVEAGSGLGPVFDPEVQSALMDISVLGTLRIERRHVTYDAPFTRLRPEELGAVSRAVATVAARVDRLGGKGQFYRD